MIMIVSVGSVFDFVANDNDVWKTVITAEAFVAAFEVIRLLKGEYEGLKLNA